MNSIRFTFCWCVFLVLCPPLSASTVLDVSTSLSNSDPTQTGRINRGDPPSNWSSAKAFPALFTSSGALHYKTFTITASQIGPGGFLQISMDYTTTGLYVVAYLDSFMPDGTATNRGLDVNYAGDIAVSGNDFGGTDTQFFQVAVPKGHDLVIVVHEVVAGNNGGNFRLLVENFADTQYTEPINPPTLATAPASGQAGAAIPLSISAAPADPAIPQALSIQLSNIPPNVTLGAGVPSGGVVTLTPVELAGLTLVSTDAQTFTLGVTVAATAIGGNPVMTTGTLKVDVAPGFLSPPSSAPQLAPTLATSSVVTGLAVEFTAIPAPSDSTVSWDFGDGSPQAGGNVVQHLYAAAGTYTVTVSVSNPRSPTVTTFTQAITVADGMTLPNTGTLSAIKGGIKLSKKNAITFSAKFALPAPIKLQGGEVLKLVFNGLTEVFTFDKKGKAKSADGTGALKLANSKKTGASGTISAKLAGDVKARLGTGVATDADGLPTVLLAVVSFQSQTNSRVIPLTFKKSKTSSSAKIAAK